MSNFSKKFLLVFWKNIVIRKSNPILTILEIIIPTFFFLALSVSYDRSVHVPAPHTDIRHHPIRSEEDIFLQFRRKAKHMNVFYAPENSFTSSVMGRVEAELGVKGFIPVDSERKLVERFTTLSLNSSFENVVYGVVFENSQTKNIKYKIRSSFGPWHTDSASWTLEEKENGRRKDYSVRYFKEGFLALQYALDKSYMEYISKIQPLPFDLKMQKFPSPKTIPKDNVVPPEALSAFTVICLVLLCPYIIKRIVQEKESGIKELMKMMGLKNWMLWFGWFINAIFVNSISVTSIVLVLTVPFMNQTHMIFQMDVTLLWVFLMMYCISSVVFCMAFSTFFSNPNIAMSCGIICWILSYVLPMKQFYDTKSLSTKLITSLHPNMALHWGFQVIQTYEAKGVGLSWGSINEAAKNSDNDNPIRMSDILAVMVLDVFIYGIVMWYVDAVLPGKYGLAKPWYFCFMVSYWKRGPSKPEIIQTSADSKEVNNFERPNADMCVGIKLKDIHKVYYSPRGKIDNVAVENVTFDIYQGQITALLGHNGAGKTTTMSILTGMIPPTSGSVIINGFNIMHDLETVRQSLSMCPQHNLLFADLTVMEHLIFFGRLKGMDKEEAKTEAEILITKLKFDHKRNKLPGQLSGGTRRKLSLAIALIGKTKVVILDEPTSGMDPEARREVWDLILSMRGSRTILITTHFMEEADVLGDRIAIMDHGRVHCYGTSLYLKKLYGAGYHLKLMKQDLCHTQKVTRLVQKQVPGSALKSDLGSELWYNLPCDQTGKFPALFDSLETNKERLGVCEMSVAVTTLEEVFIRVGELASEENRKDATKLTENLSMEDFYNKEMKKISGCPLVLQQLRAIFVKKIMCTIRNWPFLLFMVLCTVTSTILTTLMSGEHPPSSYVKEPALTLSLRYYNISTVPYSVMTGVPGLLVSTYRHLVGFEPIPPGESVSSLILDIGKENIKEYMNNIVIGAEFNTSKTRDIVVVNAMYGSTVHHAAPLSLNVINNALVKYLMASDEYSITTTNHPLPDLQLPDLSSTPDIRTTIYWSLLVPLGLFFFLGFVIAFPLEEKVNKMKQLQIMAGVSPFYYWFICFLVDYFIYLLTSVLMVVSIYICDTLNIYKQSVELGVFFLMIVLYGLSGIPYAYIFTYFKKSATDGFCHYIFSSVLIGVTILYCSFVYKLLRWMKYLLWFLPHICLSRGLNMFSAQVVKNIRCRQLKDDKTSLCTLDPFHLCCKSNFDDSSSKRHFAYLEFPHENNENGIGLEVLFLALNSVLYVGLIMLAEYGVIHKIRKVFRKSQLSNIKSDCEMDEDVVKEQIRVKKHIHETQKLGTNHDIFLVDKLVKMYQSFVAVNGISFGVKPGECFGLLGVNGAGKTTTFRMLTGDEVPSDGDAVVQRYGLRKHTRKYLSHLGYCPQSDPLNEKLTGQEMLQLVAHLRGIPRQSVQKEVTKWINLLGLSEYESSLSGTFSGGNKRKLSTAMALIGDPPIVFLDEPTSGVDPVSRRNLWEVLARIQSTGQSIVLTSHSMEECEALCNRVAIMVNGQFMCMGGNQYLKRKFGQGFTLMVKLGCIETAKELMELKDTIKMTFRPNCELKDEHKGMLHYRLLNPHIPWKVLFTSMEHLKNTTLAIEDYSISETSLEQVFLAFAKSQKD